MSDTDVRELVRIRFELRRLAGGGAGREAAAPLLARMSRLASDEALGPAVIRPEMTRWRAVFGLDA